MKKTFITLTAALALFASCSGEENKDAADKTNEKEKTEQKSDAQDQEPESETEKVTTEAEEVTAPEDEIQSRYNYDKDFDFIKEAILGKDQEGLAPFCTGDMVNAEEVINIFEDVDFAEQLKNATYESLTTNELDGGEVQLVFSGAVSFTDEEGNTFESGVYLYFKQGEPSLELDQVLVAG